MTARGYRSAIAWLAPGEDVDITDIAALRDNEAVMLTAYLFTKSREQVASDVARLRVKLRSGAALSRAAVNEACEQR